MLKQIRAPDGARIEYDLHTKPSFIVTYDHAGAQLWRIDGFITQLDIKSQVEKFVDLHHRPTIATPQPALSQLAFTD